MHLHRQLMAAVAVSVWVGTVAWGFDISSDQKIDGSTAPQIVGDGAGNTITASGATPNWNFSWSGVTTPGLNGA